MEPLKKLLAIVVLFCLAFTPCLFANIEVQEDGTRVNRASAINVSTGLNTSSSKGTTTVSLDQSGDLTFRASLLANGRAGGASTLGSSSTALTPSSMPYMTVYKKVGGGAGIDETGWGTRLQNGLPGQTLALIVTGLQGTGKWNVTPVTCTGFTQIVFDTVGDSVQLTYINDTLGWVLTSTSGVTLKGTGYGSSGAE